MDKTLKIKSKQKLAKKSNKIIKKVVKRSKKKVKRKLSEEELNQQPIDDPNELLSAKINYPTIGIVNLGGGEYDFNIE